MFRKGNYPGASGEGEGGGFTFKSIHIFKGSLSATSFNGILLVQFRSIIFCG